MADRIKPRPSSQYELFKQNLKANSIDQGGAPDMPVETPPENRPNINRGTITAKSNDGHNEINITLETIDEAIFHYFNNAIEPKILVNDNLVNVPVIYGAGEAWKLAQKDGYYRDKGGKIQTPLIMLKRDSIEKNRGLGNKLDANAPQLYVTFEERYTKRNQYDNFSTLTNRIPQKEFTSVVVPDYINITYSGIIWTDYVAHMNTLIEAIEYASDSYWGDPERFKFMAMIDSFTNQTELSVGDNRLVRSNFNISLQGYIIPDHIQKQIKSQNTKAYSRSVISITETPDNVPGLE